MSERTRLLEREGESHEAVARASVRLCATMAACARRLDRRLLGPNEGRRREAKDDAVLGSVGGIRTGRRWGGYGYEQKQRSKEGAGKAAAKRDSGEGMITGYHISGPLLRVLRVSPFFSGDPSPSPYTNLPSLCVYLHLLSPSCSSSRRCYTDQCRATSSTFADSFCLFLPLRLRLKPFLYSLFHPLLCPPFLLPTRSSFLLLRLVYVVLLDLFPSPSLSLSLFHPTCSPSPPPFPYKSTSPRRGPDETR